MAASTPPSPSSSSEEALALANAKALIERTGLAITPQEWSTLRANDFGFGQLLIEGFVFIDLLRTERVRITLLVLLPNQTLPEHLHPAYGDEPGKEETLRCLWGKTHVVMPGEPTPGLIVPAGKEAFYTVRHAVTLRSGEQCTVPPVTRHWFQAGPDGSVNLAFQNRVDEAHNIFTEDGGNCPIPA
jgi:quercetin dioxygenase-like cupin family protein